jgi:hypothetical protein
LASSSFAAESHVIGSKLRAKFSTKKITIKGKVMAMGEWPLTLRVALIDEDGEEISSASDTLRAPDGPGSFQMELAVPRGHRFDRVSLANAQVRYRLRRGKTDEDSGAVRLAAVCPNLMRKKHKWWPW